MKLELKHLAPYLPYRLMIECQNGDSDCRYKGMKKSLSIFSIENIDGVIWKPMMLPISDLDTETMLNDLGGKSSDNIIDFIDYFNSDNANKDVAILQAPYPIIEWCLENHYDIFGLIEEGLAIKKTTHEN